MKIPASRGPTLRRAHPTNLPLRERSGGRQSAVSHQSTTHAVRSRYLAELLDRNDVALGGISAAEHHQLGIVADDTAEIYVTAEAHSDLLRTYRFSVAGTKNLTVHVPALGQPALDRVLADKYMSLGVVAVDLAESVDVRSSALGIETINELVER